jgi:GNAT superfamily N-acetyltransferase
MIESRETNVIIRDVRSEEIPEVSGLILEAYKQYESLMPPLVWDQYARDMNDVQSRLPVSDLIVAEWEGRLAGAVTFFPETSSGQEGWPPSWASVRLLAVAPNGRGLGIGRELMNECLRRCRESGVAVLGLHTIEFMEVARRLYETMGFVRATEFDYDHIAGITILTYRLDL